jgi:hypothetical protein
MSDDCSIYVIACVKDGKLSAPVKIGISSNVDKRLSGIQTSCPFELTIVGELFAPNRAVAQDVEQDFHAKQAKHRTRGEWFDIEPMTAVLLVCANYRDGLETKRPDLSADELEKYLRRADVIDTEKYVGMIVRNGANTNH